jgi:hypothetical protein
LDDVSFGHVFNLAERAFVRPSRSPLIVSSALQKSISNGLKFWGPDIFPTCRPDLTKTETPDEIHSARSGAAKAVFSLRNTVAHRRPDFPVAAKVEGCTRAGWASSPAPGLTLVGSGGKTPAARHRIKCRD